jgi:hypothetical protein
VRSIGVVRHFRLKIRSASRACQGIERMLT